jgi:signal transduction histidine kinase/predicted Ser/Thr protein kinase
MDKATHPQIPGYQILEEIGRGARGIVYRAKRGESIYAIKMQEKVEDRSLLSYGAVLACVRHPGLPEIVEVNEAGQRAYLVREYIPGYTLAAELETGPLTETRIVDIAKTLAGALHQVHQHGLIHRDVKPANIMLSRDGRVHLIDFGFATQLHNSAHSTVGTYLYSAPEQMKALEAPIDQRSDLYALGAVLYACATGEPPYYSKDTAELLLLHATAGIPSVQDKNPEVSPALALCIEKLLSKDPRDRYLTGASLLADLQALKRLNQRLTKGEEIVLGGSARELHDRAQTLVGRESELLELEHQLGDILKGIGRSLLVTGVGGIGKTVLVKRFLRRLERTRPVVLNARCEKGQAPFSTVRDWVEDYFQQFKAFPEAQRQLVADKLEVLNENSAGLLVRLGRAAQEFFPPLPEHQEVESNHFIEVAASFFLELARLHGFLVLFLDDAHHLDESEHAVIDCLRKDLDNAPLLLLATSRQRGDEAEGYESYKKTAEPDTEVELAPLEHNEVQTLVFSLLGARPVAPEISQQIHKRSQGNPFAANEYLHSMLRSGVVLPTLEGWRLDDRALHKLALPDDVMALVLQRLHDLGQDVESVLSRAAVFGVRFRVHQLQTFASCSLEELQKRLEEALSTNILETSDSESFTFVHDRVKEALLSNLSSEEKARIHHEIAEGLSRLTESYPELHYAVARHYSLAGSEGEDSYQSNLLAGRMALEDDALEDAYKFLTDARKHALDEQWQEPLSSACERTGRTEEAIVLLEQLEKKPENSVQHALFLMRLSNLRHSKIDPSQARKDSLEALRVIGETPTERGPAATAVRAGYYFGKLMLTDRFLNLPKPQSVDKLSRELTLTQLYQSLSVGEFQNLNFGKMIEWGSLASLTSRKTGLTPQLLTSYSNFMIPFGQVGGKKLLDWWRGRLDEILDQLDDPYSKSYVELIYKLAMHLAGGGPEVDRDLDNYLRERHHLIDSGIYLLAIANLSWVYLMRGQVEKAWAWIQRGIERSKLSSSQTGVTRDLDILACYALSCLAILGRPGEAAQFLTRVEQQVEAGKANISLRLHHAANLLLFRRECGELKESADSAVELYMACRPDSVRVPMYRLHFYPANMYRWMDRAFHPAGGEEDIQGFRHAVTAFSKKAKHPILKAHLLVGVGARDYLSGNTDQALDTLAQATKQAELNALPWVTFEVARLKARIFKSLNLDSEAQRQAQTAYDLAKTFNWPQRARAVAAEFSFQRSTQSISASRSTTLGGQSDRELAEKSRLRRQLDALLNLSLASGKLQSPMEQAQVALDELISLLRAERAYLFLIQDQELEFVLGRQVDGATLDVPTGYSRTVIEAVDLTHQPVVLAGTEEGQVLSSESVIAHDIRSIICAPLSIRDRFVGVIYLDNRLARGVFNHQDIDILTALSSHIAVALETARVSKLELDVLAERRRRELSVVLQDFISSLTATQEPTAISRLLLKAVKTTLPWQRALCWSTSAEDELRLLAQDGFNDLPGADLTTSPTDCEHLQRTLHSSKPVRESGVTSEPGLPDQQGLSESWDWVGIPLISDQGTEGVLALSFAAGCELCDEDLQTAFAFSQQAAVALSNAKLFQQVKDALEELRLSQAQTLDSSRLAAVGRLAAGVAHEVNTPLNAILIASELGDRLIDRDTEKARSQFQTVIRASMNAQKCVQRLLHYAQPDRFQEGQSFDVGETLDDALELLTFRIDRAGVEIEREGDEGIRLQGSQHDFYTLSSNLVLNALDACSGQDEPAVKVRLTRADGESILLEIEDNGPGIPADLEKEIFQPFFTTKPSGEGNGLGLYLARQAAEKLGGTLTYSKSESGGALFKTQFIPG